MWWAVYSYTIDSRIAGRLELSSMNKVSSVKEPTFAGSVLLKEGIVLEGIFSHKSVLSASP
jgi:hypothetical protein